MNNRQINNRMITLEGICCSGKTTFSNKLIEHVFELDLNGVYNHGAMTYTNLGREFYDTTSKMDTSISALYYFIDLIINTRDFIKPTLQQKDIVIVQDRYFDSITTYTNAYGIYFEKNYNIYRAAEVLLAEGYLIQPMIKVFCIPPYDVIVERMRNSKKTKVHDFYRAHPNFLKVVYDELKKKAYENCDAIVVDTSSDNSIGQAIDSILAKLEVENEL